LQQAIKTEISNVGKTYTQDQGKAALTKLANILYTAAKKSQQAQTASPSKIPQTTLAESKKKVIRNWGIK
jgi:soluble cytochrome b562